MPVKSRVLKFAIWTAGANRVAWQNDFQFQGAAADMPVLECRERFRRFVKDYGLLRRGYKDAPKIHMRIRDKLYQDREFSNALEDRSGRGIDTIAAGLSKDIGIKIERSLVSKLAAFAKPEIFIAWDRYARKGATILGSGSISGNFRSYESYLGCVIGIKNGNIGQEMRREFDNLTESIRAPTENTDAFFLRVLDVYLMIEGGRWNLAELD